MLESRIAGMVIQSGLEAFRGKRKVAARAGQPAEVETGLGEPRVGLHGLAIRRDGLLIEPKTLLCAAEIVPCQCVQSIDRVHYLEAAAPLHAILSMYRPTISCT